MRNSVIDPSFVWLNYKFSTHTAAEIKKVCSKICPLHSGDICEYIYLTNDEISPLDCLSCKKKEKHHIQYT